MKTAGSEKKTRHADLAAGLSAIKAYLARERTGDYELYGTNWRTTPDNDNQPQTHRVQRDPDDGHPIDDGPDHGYDVDRRMEFKPSIRWMAKQWNEGAIVRNRYGQIISIGTLHFAGGDHDPFDTPSERGYKLGPDGRVVIADIRMPAGAMLWQEERMDRMRGTDNRKRADKPADEALLERHVREGNEYIAETLKAHLPRDIRGKRKKRGAAISKQQAIVDYEKAVALTIKEKGSLPPVKKFPAGLPWGPAELWTIFPSLVRGYAKDNGAMSWQDIAVAKVNEEIWAEALAALDAEHRAVLAALPSAQNMTDIGVAAGQSESYARSGGGIRVLQAVNDNLADELRKAA